MVEAGLFKFKAEERSDVDEMPLGTSQLTGSAGIERTKPKLASIAKSRANNTYPFCQIVS